MVGVADCQKKNKGKKATTVQLWYLAFRSGIEFERYELYEIKQLKKAGREQAKGNNCIIMSHQQNLPQKYEFLGANRNYTGKIYKQWIMKGKGENKNLLKIFGDLEVAQ